MKQTPVAIIGMGCFFPKSPGLKEYWRLLFHGEDAVTEVPASHWSPEDYFDKDPKCTDHVYCKRGGFLSPVSFDPSEFGIPPTAMEATDTSQLLALLAAKRALEDAGYGEDKDFDRNKVSVVLGVTGTQELVIPLGARLGFPKWRNALKDAGISSEKIEEVLERIGDAYVPWQENSFPGLLGNVVAGRICNKLDLGGTNCVVDAACASSMSALHLALLELSTGRSDMVISGGVDALNDIFMHTCFSKTFVLSHTGDAKPFSKNADGTVLGEGLGLVVLKRLEDAEKDGDKIYAVIKGVGSSSDGKSQSIYAPRKEGQIKAIRKAYEVSDVSPNTVEMVEAHGTGTKVGDAVEFSGLKEVFNESGAEQNSCAVGSVKSMIGHTKAAAGAAGLVKAALALYHKVLPPTLKVEEPDPNLGIEQSPFYLSMESRPWFSKKDHPRRSGVSAFGFGGSNFHAVLEEYDKQKQEPAWDGSVEIVALSAKSRSDLLSLLNNFKQDAEGLSEQEMAVKAYQSRQKFSSDAPYRILLVIERDGDKNKIFNDAVNALQSENQENSFALGNIFYSCEKPGKLAVMFPGQGSQYVNMGRDIVSVFPQAFDFLEKANEKFDLPNRLTDYVYPISTRNPDEKAKQEERLRMTDIAQPAIGAVSTAMLKVLEWFGLSPDAFCGHSYGELCALYAGGGIETDAFFELSQLRGKLMAEASRINAGTMLAVKAPLESVEQMIRESQLNAVLANRNAPEQAVLSGSFEDIAKAEEVCRQKGFGTKRLPVSAAFHSELMKEAWKSFTEIMKKIKMMPSQILVLSNVTGREYPEDVELAKKLLTDQIISTVDFVNEIKYLFQIGIRTVVEVGPKTVLTGLVRSILIGLQTHALSMDGSSGKRFGIADLARLLSHLAALGHVIDLKKWEHPAPMLRKQKMSIPICGANYRAARKAKTYTKAKPPEKSSFAQNKPSITPAVKRNDAAVETRKAVNTMTKKTIPVVNTQGSSYLAGDALKAVQEGLKSMQSLHHQTALTHQKFLESQTEASRTLQRMMENTQRIAELSMGVRVSEYVPATLPYVEANNHSPLLIEPPTKPPPPPKIQEVKQEVKAIKIELPKPSAAKTDTPLTPLKRGIEQTLLEVVSHLTGYPPEMLSLEMDIESDLGIDSIKRVEILSSFEEKMPGLPSISPEMMGTLKTLGQIVQYLSSGHDLHTPDPSQEGKKVEPITVQVSDNNGNNPKIADTLLGVVSQLTGYPTEMLSLEMDIESDLGIDSIKRVEILSSFEEKMPGLPSISPEMMGTLKTLGQIVQYLSNGHGHTPNPSQEGKNAAQIIAKSDISELKTDVERRIVLPMPLDEKGESFSLPFGRKVLIADDGSALAASLVSAFESLNIASMIISPSMPPDMTDVSGLVILGTDDNFDDHALKNAFLLAKKFGHSLSDSAKQGGAIFASISAMGGIFGFDNSTKLINPTQGGLAGLVKTAAIEWEGVCCHAIDITRNDKDNPEIAKLIAAEILSRSPIEIGIQNGKRFSLNLKIAPYPEGEIALETGDVVVITGGARGVTAEAACALAEYANPVMLLLGRSPQIPEPQWLSGLVGANDYSPLHEAQMKKAILENEFSGNHASPMQVEKSFRRYQANREIINTLSRLKSMGITAVYRSADVRDINSISPIFEEIRQKYGAIRAIIHGAGILEDRLIVDKTAEQFERVFDTKVKGLRTLLEATRHDPLQYIVLFSSVSARFGNKGQSDYAVANEVLNKTARTEAASRQNCRVISINWGPWDGGMVSPALKREFARQGVSLIPLQAGAVAMVCEMRGNENTDTEVVIGSGFETQTIPKPELSITVKREINLERLPILRSHILNGKAVIPFALMTEWLGHSALHEHPGFFLHGLEDIRLFQGIKITEEKRLIRLLAGKARRNGTFYEVDTELRDGNKTNSEFVHFKAKAILSDTPSHKSPTFTMPSDMTPYSKSMTEVYERILFHGVDLRGIQEIRSCCPSHIAAKISSAPSPSAWMAEPFRSRWISDPMVLDCAFQMAIVWCFEEQGKLSLPSYAASYRQYRSQFPSEGVTAVLEIRELSSHKMKGDFTFLDENNSVIAQLKGYEAIMDKSLTKAFHNAG